MDKYTASNGIGVRIDSPYLDIKDGVSWRGIAGSRELIALREFFAHERDDELGRWRWPENPDYVVYPRADHVQVVNESSGNALNVSRAQANISTGLARAARAYFEAHPERKPWDDAKPGEVWVVTEGDLSETYAYLVDDGQFYDSARDYALDFTDPVITAARRIWPESD